MSEFSFDRNIDFLDLTPPKHYNVGLLPLFWWFWDCAFALLIHSFSSVYIVKTYDVCMKTTWKIIIIKPSRCHENAGNGLQKSKFSWGGMPPLDRRAYGTLSPPPLTEFWIRPCSSSGLILCWTIDYNLCLDPSLCMPAKSTLYRSRESARCSVRVQACSYHVGVFNFYYSPTFYAVLYLRWAELGARAWEARSLLVINLDAQESWQINCKDKQHL